MTTLKERRRQKAVAWSKRNSRGHKTTVRSAEDLERLKRYNFRKILFRKFKI